MLSRVERGRLEIEAEPLEPRRLLERIVDRGGRRPPDASRSSCTSIRTCRSSPASPRMSSRSSATCWATRRSTRPPGPHVTVSARRHGTAVEIRVCDDGPGHPGSVGRRGSSSCSTAIRTSARVVAGSGIGLFVCASLVEAMGGTHLGARAGRKAAPSSGSPAGPRGGRRRRRRTPGSSPGRPGRAARGPDPGTPVRSEGQRIHLVRVDARARGSPWPPWPGSGRRSARAPPASPRRYAAGRSRTARAGPRACRSGRTRRCPSDDVVVGQPAARPCPGRAFIQSVAATIGPPSAGRIG